MIVYLEQIHFLAGTIASGCHNPPEISFKEYGHPHYRVPTEIIQVKLAGPLKIADQTFKN